MGKKSGHGEVEISYARRDHHTELLDVEEERALDDAYRYDPYDECTDEQRARYYSMGFHKGYERNVEESCRSVLPREGHEPESTAVKLVAVKKSALKKHKKQQQHVASSQETAVQIEDGEQPPATVSRKERKKRAAQLRATTAPLFCESVMRGDNSTTSTAAAVDSDRTVMPRFVSHPLRDLPADVILNVLVVYLPPQDLKALIIASIGVDLLMKTNEAVWQRLFEEQQMGRTYSDRFNKLRRQMFEAGDDAEMQQKWSYIVRHITRMSGPATLSDKQCEEQERCFDSEGSAIVRALMKEKTAVWETQEIEVVEHYRSLGTRHPFSLPLVKYMCRRSEAFPKQYICNHRRVVMDMDHHWFVCLDCRLYTHAGFDRQDIWHQDSDPFSV